MKFNKVAIFFPFIIALALATGVYMGTRMNFSNETILFNLKEFNSNDKLQQIISYINSDYVDSVQSQEIVEQTISEVLQNLDPHSYYIPKQDYNEMNDPLQGNFEGIGIEFRIQEDTITVVQALGGGPSEEVGIMPGDRIVEVDGENVTGKTINNKRVVKLLKGPKGTMVKIGVKRKRVKTQLEFAIQRDKIPLYSVEGEHMVTQSIGYLKVLRFAKDTYREFMNAVNELKSQGMQQLIVDLRNNAGGYMKSAISLSDEFLPSGKMIVYTEGKAREKREYYATSQGKLEDIEVVILINEGSASASEILAGALQDNDKGHIVGRRSFGKGLVQEEMQWPDGSTVRLTVARYYTPTGRSIQKPYENGLEEYNRETFERYNNGELLNLDSIDLPDSLKYITKGGKILYGGGGIMPDVFVPIDTSGTSFYFGNLNYQGMFFQFGFYYVDNNRESLLKESNAQSFNQSFIISNAILEEFYEFAASKGIKYDEKGAKTARQIIKNRLKASIGRNLFQEKVFYQVINEEDKAIKTAIKLLTKEHS